MKMRRPLAAFLRRALLLLPLAAAACGDVHVGVASLKSGGAPAAVGVAANAIPKAHGCDVERVSSVKLENLRNVWLLPIEVNGTELRVILDTGAERTLLTEAAVQRLGLPRDPHHETRTFGIGGPSTTADARVSSFAIGGAALPVASVTVGHFALPTAPGQRLDGLLGADILSAFDIDFDAQNNELTLYRARACPHAGPPWRDAYLSFGDVRLSRNRLLLPIALDGTPGFATLDTGAQHSAVSVRLAERVGVTAAELADDRSITARGASPGQISIRIHRFDELQIGPATVHGPVLPVVPMPEGLGDGLVGADFLAGRRVWMSYASSQVFVTTRRTNPAVAMAR